MDADRGSTTGRHANPLVLHVHYACMRRCGDIMEEGILTTDTTCSDRETLRRHIFARMKTFGLRRHRMFVSSVLEG